MGCVPTEVMILDAQAMAPLHSSRAEGPLRRSPSRAQRYQSSASKGHENSCGLCYHLSWRRHGLVLSMALRATAGRDLC